MVECEVNINFRTHNAHVRVYEDKIVCFKYTRRQCRLEVFTDQEEAADFLFTGIDPFMWGIEFDDGSNTNC